MRWQRVSWALLVLFVFTIPWEKSIQLAGFGTGSKLVGLGAFAAGVIAAWQHRTQLRRPNAILLAGAAFVLWSSLTWFWSLDAGATAARAATFAQLLAMTWLVWESTRDEKEQRQLLHAYVAGAVVASAATFLRYAQGQQTYWRRYAAPGFDPNDLGVTVALAIPLALYLALRDRSYRAWLYRSAVAMCTAAVLLTASRTALIAASAAFAFVFLTWRESARAQRAAGLALLGFLLAGAFVLAPKASRERLSTLPGELTSGTLHNRTRIWKSGLKAFKQHPIIGVGSGAFPDAVRPWIGVPGRAGHEYVAHNTPLSVLVETGAAGGFLYGVMLLLAAAFVWAMAGSSRALWAVVLIVWAIGVSTLTWEHRKVSWLLLALLTTEWARCFEEQEPRT
jgi:O-antigen ligase